MGPYLDHLIPRGTKHTLLLSQPTNWQNGPLSGPRGIKLYYYYHNIPTDRMDVYLDHLIPRGTKHTLTLSQPTNWQNGPLSGPFDNKGNQTQTNTITAYQLAKWAPIRTISFQGGPDTHYYYHNLPTGRMGPYQDQGGIKLYYYYHNIPTDRMEVHRDHVITRGTKHTLLLSQPTDWQNGPLSGPFDIRTI